MRGLETKRRKILAVLVFAATAYGSVIAGIAVWHCYSGNSSQEDQIVLALFGMLFFCAPLWLFPHREFIRQNIAQVLGTVVTLMTATPVLLYLTRDDTGFGKFLNDVRSLGGFAGKAVVNIVAIFLFWLFCYCLFRASRATFRSLLEKAENGRQKQFAVGRNQ